MVSVRLSAGLLLVCLVLDSLPPQGLSANSSFYEKLGSGVQASTPTERLSNREGKKDCAHQNPPRDGLPKAWERISPPVPGLKRWKRPLLFDGLSLPRGPKLYRIHATVYREPTNIVSAAALAYKRKMDRLSMKLGVNQTTCFSKLQPVRPPGGEKNLSSFPPDVNLDLVELFSVFFKPNSLWESMAVAKPGTFTLRDIDQKVVLKVHNSLVASPETNNAFAVRISVVPNPYLDAQNFPIIMGVDGGARCLSSGQASKPVLKLENQRIMDLYHNSDNAKRFTFTCSFQGSTQSFESFAYAGWYLSTSQYNNEPVRVTDQLGETDITDFYFRKVQ